MKAVSERSESSERIPYSPYPSSILGKDDGKESWGILSEVEDRAFFRDTWNERRNRFSIFS